MTEKADILEAHNKVYSVIQSANLWSNLRNEAEKAATLLRDTALKAIPEPTTATATQLDARAEKAEIIAQGDSLDTLAALIPYLLHRRELARHYTDRPDSLLLGEMEKVNQKIAEVLNIF